jgi:hypothetical protein
MTSLFTKDTLDKSIFKWEDLAGKELVIRVGKCPDDLGKGMHVCVIGVEKSDVSGTGKCYVLVNEFRGFGE